MTPHVSSAKKIKMSIKADHYFSNKDMVDEYEEFGMDCIPVDPFGGYVASDKEADNDLKETQESIQNRFQLNE